MTGSSIPAAPTADVQYGFSPGAVVLVKQLDSKDWEVERGFTYRGKSQTFEVCVGERTDFASVPRVLVWFLPRYGDYTIAAILHDHLWRIEAPAGRISYRDSDATLRRAMRERSIPFLTRWIMWAAVRWASIFTRRGGRRGAWRDLPRMIAVTIPTLPVLLPAIIVVLLSIAVIQVLEWLFYLPLQLNRTVRQRNNRPAKRVNRPQVSWKL